MTKILSKEDMKKLNIEDLQHLCSLAFNKVKLLEEVEKIGMEIEQIMKLRGIL